MDSDRIFVQGSLGGCAAICGNDDFSEVVLVKYIIHVYFVYMNKNSPKVKMEHNALTIRTCNTLEFILLLDSIRRRRSPTRLVLCPKRKKWCNTLQR